MYDVVIIGGGITGCSIARELSRYHLKVCVLEKEADLCCGTSKANSAIVHAGYDAKPGTLKAKLNVEGNVMYSRVCKELAVPFKRVGSVVVAFSEEEVADLKVLYERGLKNGVSEISIVNQEELRALEPNISTQAVAALYTKTAGIVCPFTLTIATAENAYTNGVNFFFNAEVKEVRVLAAHNGRFGFLLKTRVGSFESKYIVNAAGLYADLINQMIGGEPFSLIPRKGEYCIFDKDQGYLAKTVIFQVPTKMGKGILVSPTIDGNLLIGPTAQNIEDKQDTTTTEQGIQEIITGAKKSVPSFAVQKTITSFAGLRSVPNTEDFIISADKRVKGLVHAAGIESPGLTSVPAIAKMVREILEEEGLRCKRKRNFHPYRQPIIRFSELSPEKQRRLVRQNPNYGRVICRCETITEGEIIEAIQRPLGARDLDGVKRRTRAGMGRCQGGFCGPRVIEILARELKIPLNQVTKCGRASYALDGKTKDSGLEEKGGWQ